MVWARVNDVAKYGVIQDVPSKGLPPGAWTGGRNVRFSTAHVDPIRDATAIAGAARHEALIGTQFLVDSGALFTLYAGSTDASFIDDSNNHNPALAAGVPSFTTQPGRWTVTKLGSVPVLNNRDLAAPLWWDGSQNKLIQLPNWPANLACHSLRAFKNHLIALRCVESGMEYPHMIRWSHPADPGSPPPSWDYSNMALDAGRVELGELDTPIVDGLPLGPAFFIYRTGSVHRMDYIGPPLVFAFQTVFDNFGALGTNCVKSWRGAHIVMTADDIVAHDGQQVKSLLNDRIRSFYKSELASDGDVEHAFLVVMPATDEAWAFLPNSDRNQPPQVAIVVNLKTGACSIVDEQAWSAWLGKPIGAPDSWDGGDPSSWDSGPGTPWSGGSGASALAVFLGRVSDIAEMDSASVKAGWLERIGLPVSDHQQHGLLRRLRFTLDDATGLRVKVGVSSSMGSPPAFGPSGAPIPGSGDVPVLRNGVWHAMRLEWDQGAQWHGFTGYAADFLPVGEF